MSAPKGNKNGIGNSGGIGVNDRHLAAEVRRLTLNKIKDLFTMPTVKMSTDDYDLYKAVLIKLAGSVLPRLQEVTGEDGGAIVVQMSKTIAEKNGITNESDTITGQDSSG